MPGNMDAKYLEALPACKEDNDRVPPIIRQEISQLLWIAFLNSFCCVSKSSW